MRVPYAPTEPTNPADAPIYSRIAARRAPRPLIPLDLALLHNPQVADGWNSFIGAIRSKTFLDPGLRELAIARVAVLNHAVHEWDSHAPLALRLGVSREGLQTVRSASVVRKGEDGKREGGGLSREMWAVLAYTDQMTREVDVDDSVADALREFMEDQQVVELTATVAAYNCVSRFLVALDVGECNGREMMGVEDMER
ncbi:4-carboxymuconolactone decarboxylase-like protein [Lojkania enalia]|uniref:4-carboxymuconolactone decarboxylase-like protein n=1 Tax=Lojkania enalia TaxID=147567 RepID=A0A9P4K8P0_9PLEO|nr:4-carboxymuconolactone decarboxylase-like protein [Didymosphaeria enalia]